MSDVPPVTELDYRSGTVELRPMSMRAAAWVAGFSFVPAAGGLLILAMFAWLANDAFTDVGVVWFFVGGGMTLVMSVLTLANAPRATARRRQQPGLVRRYAWAGVGVLTSVAAAVLCVACWAMWYLKPHVPLAVTNATPTGVDRVVIHFTSGDVAVGPLRPGETRSLGHRWLLNRPGPLEITTTVGDKTRRRVDRDDTDLWYEKQPYKHRPLTIVVEPPELPPGGP